MKSSEINPKEIKSYVPYSMNELHHIMSFEYYFDKDVKREIRLSYDKAPILLEANTIILAKYPKEAKLEDSIIFHPRYAPNKNDFEFIEVKAFRNGRTIDIYYPLEHKDNQYQILNVKGVGAFAEKKFMVMKPGYWFNENNEWVQNSEDKASLGRGWGVVDQSKGRLEYESDEMENLGIGYIPHLRFNVVPKGIIEFSEISQLSRGLNTNIRCNHAFDYYFQENYINSTDFASIDAKVFGAQKELFKKNQSLKIMGWARANRYIDGKYTDLENISIKKFSKKDLFFASVGFLTSAFESAFCAMNGVSGSRSAYVGSLGAQTGINLSKLAEYDPKIFTEYENSEEYDKKYGKELQTFKNELRKQCREYYEIPNESQISLAN